MTPTTRPAIRPVANPSFAGPLVASPPVGDVVLAGLSTRAQGEGGISTAQPSYSARVASGLAQPNPKVLLARRIEMPFSPGRQQKPPISKVPLMAHWDHSDVGHYVTKEGAQVCVALLV